MEILGAFGLVNMLVRRAIGLSKYDDGQVPSYAIYMMLGLIILIFTVTISYTLNISSLTETSLLT